MYCIIFPTGGWFQLNATTFADAEAEARRIVKELKDMKGRCYFIAPTGSFSIYHV